jgi:hypothetical protein
MGWKKHYLRFAFFSLVGIASASGMDLSVAKIIVIGEGQELGSDADPGKDLEKILCGERRIEGLSVASLSGSRAAPVSYLDAAAVCQQTECGYLLYGLVERKANALRAELKLMNGETRSVAAFFYGADTPENYDRLMDDIARKVSMFFQESFGIGSGGAEKTPARGIVLLSADIGWPLPLGDYGKAMYGLAAARFGARIIPAYPGFQASERGYWAFGCDIGYSLFKSFPRYEDAVVHDVAFLLPVECDIDDEKGNTVFASLAAGIDLSTMVQSRKYAEVLTRFAAAPSTAVAFGYRYRFPNDKAMIGIAGEINIAFYESPIASICLSLEYAFAAGSGRLREITANEH